MRTHRVVWTVVVAGLVGTGLVLGAVGRPLAVAVLAAAGAAAGAVWAGLGLGRRVGTAAAAAGAVTGSLAGLAPALQGGVVLLGVLVLATAPGVVVAYDHWVESMPTPSRRRWDAMVEGVARTAPGYVPPSPTARLSDEQLRRQWDASGAALRAGGPAERLLAVVELRQQLLEEHDRRHPEDAAGAGTDWDDLVRRLQS